MRRQPRLDSRRLVDLRVINDDGEMSEERCGVRLIERVEQIKKKPRLFALPYTMGDHPGGDVQGPGQIALLVGARRQPLAWFPFGHPLRADLREQSDIQLVRTEPRGARPQLCKR